MEEGVQFLFLTNPKGFIGDNHVEALQLVKMELSLLTVQAGAGLLKLPAVTTLCPLIP